MNIYKIVLLILFPVLVHCQNSSWTNSKALQGSFSSYQLMDANTGKIVDAFQDNLLLNPASTMKVISCFQFLDQFGEDFQFETRVYANGRVKAGTLYGDLVIEGDGDPALGSRRFETWQMEDVLEHIYIAMLKENIHCIEGNIIIDASYYGSDCTPGSWDFNDLGNYYAAGIWSVNFNENRYEIEWRRHSYFFKFPTDLHEIVSQSYWPIQL